MERYPEGDAMKTTLNEIKKYGPCFHSWKILLRSLGKTRADDEPLKITTILDSNGLDDALWCLRAVDDRERQSALVPIRGRQMHRQTNAAREIHADLLRIVCAEIEQRP